MPLANIECAFVGSLLHAQNKDSEFLKKLLPLATLSEEKQLSIYRSNVNGAHQKVLGQVYPACLNILGEDYFNQLCREYRFQYPSVEPDLNVYGENFPFFLQEQIKLHSELSDYEYLVELALLEWHWHVSYYAKDDIIFDFSKLALVKPEEQDKLSFILNDSFFLHSTFLPLLKIWKANTHNIGEKQTFESLGRKNYFCISRFNLQPEITELSKYQFVLLDSISQGIILTNLANIDAEMNEGFQEQLVYFIEKGWITDFSVNLDII